MIILFLLVIKSLCLFCQRLVLDIHDRWVNPKNVRLLKEASETIGERKALLEQQSREAAEQKRLRRAQLSQSYASGGTDSILREIEACRFCENTPQGYCRHHFHLQELQVQKEKLRRREYQPKPIIKTTLSFRMCPLNRQHEQQQLKQEYRELRRINRELRSNLKNRLTAQQQQEQHYKKYQTLKSHLNETPVPSKSNFLMPLDESIASASNSANTADISAHLCADTPTLSICDLDTTETTVEEDDCESSDSAHTETTTLSTHL